MTFEQGLQFLWTIVEIDSWAKEEKSMWAKQAAQQMNGAVGGLAKYSKVGK